MNRQRHRPPVQRMPTQRLVGAITRGALACLFLISCHGRPRFEDKPTESLSAGIGTEGGSEAFIARIGLESGAMETIASGGLFPGPARRTFTGLVRSVERLKADADARGVFVTLGGEHYDWAQVEELSRLFQDLRKAKKPIVCHAHGLYNATAWLALSGCDKVWVSAAGEVSTVGIAAQLTYLRKALENLSIEAELLSMGRYKSGAEPLTRDEPSEPSRENLLSVLRSIRQTWLSAASQGKADVKHALEQGPYTPSEALKLGLIDGIGFESEALESLRAMAGTRQLEVAFGPGAAGPEQGLGELARFLSGADEHSQGRPHIAVVPAVGGITVSAESPFGNPGITSSGLTKVLRRLAKDEATRAVVIRMDSPGGSPLASDLLWHELMELKKKKPVIVSIAGMAASGGYYIACAADHIVAERTSIVGSIGVFGGKIFIGPALERLGISTHTLAASDAPGAAQRAAYLSPLTPWDDATRERVRSHMEGIYDLFLRRVAKGRKLQVSEVMKHAEGAVFTGAQAKSVGLVDELGGLESALNLARKRASLDEDAPVLLEGDADTLFDSLFGDDDLSAKLKAVLKASHPTEGGAAVPVTLPHNLQRFVESLLPLAQGEASVVALPWALQLD